jgi:transcriptional regulator with XRE-family HTH domain
MSSHHGQTIEKTIRRGGYSLSQVARLLEVNRRTIYNWFDQHRIRPSVIYQLGHAMGHDFSTEFPELFTSADFIFKKKSYTWDHESSISTDEQLWKEKYESLEERYSRLLEDSLRKQQFEARESA